MIANGLTVVYTTGIMNEQGRNWIDWLIGPVLGLTALVVYGLTLSAGAYPGQSANLIVQYTGLFPRMTPDHPLWGALVWIFAKIPVGGPAFRLNILSALCSAGSIWLIYEIMAGTIYSTIQIDNRNRIRAGIAARVAGIASAIFLAFCIPFWIVSNRAHTASFDILLLLAATGSFFLYARTAPSTSLPPTQGYGVAGRTGKERFALIFAFIYGLGIVEFATFIILAPLFGFYLLFLLWKNGNLRAGPISRILACSLAGLSLYLIAAWCFYGSAGYELRGYPGFFKIVWFMWRDQYFLITRSLPQVGWFIILFVTVVPWLICLLVARRALNDEKDWAYYLLHVVITGIAVSILLNMKLAPWPMLGMGRLLVMPYVLTASVFGYLVAYWFLLPAVWWPDAEKPVKLWLRKWLGAIFIMPGLVLVCFAPFRNLAEADGRPARLVNWYAGEIVKSLSDRSWLVTDGSIDNHLLIAARDLDRPLRLLNLRAGDNEVYSKYMATMFERPRLKNLAQIGMLPLLQEWLKSDPEIDKKVAILSAPDLWLSTGFTVVPNKLVFLGTKKPDELDAVKHLAEHERFWSKLVPVIKKMAEEIGPSGAFGKHVLRHIGFVANNLGVLMEDLGRKNEAFSAYSKAREIDPDNVSALLNLSAMVEKGFPAEQSEIIKKEMSDLIANLQRRYHIWSLSRYYGYVRAPEAFARLGWIWALSGQPGLAVSGLEKAMDLWPDDRRGGVKQTLADIYFSQEEDEKSEALYNELLAKNPENQRALLGLIRIAGRKGDFKKAKELLKKARQAGVPKFLRYMEWASLHLAAGNVGQARIILEEVVELKPDLVRPWAMLAEILIQQDDQPALEKCIKRLGELKEAQTIVSIMEGRLALRQKDGESARKYFEEALAVSPNNLQVLEWILRVDVLQGRTDAAYSHVRKLLRLNPENAVGNYILGSLQLKNGQYTLAEDSLRKSLETRKSPAALNDLAWLLQERESYTEAEKLARDTLKMNGRMPQAWDTLGVILMKTGRHDEAEKALERSLSLFQGDLNVFLHMAELQVLKGNKEKALELVEMLSKKRDQLSSSDRAKLERLRREL